MAKEKRDRTGWREFGVDERAIAVSPWGDRVFRSGDFAFGWGDRGSLASSHPEPDYSGKN